MRNFFRRISVLAVITVAFIGLSFAQTVTITITAMDKNSGSALSKGSVTVYKGTNKVEKGKFDDTGKCEIVLDLGVSYYVECEVKNYHPDRIILMTVVPENYKKDKFETKYNFPLAVSNLPAPQASSMRTIMYDDDYGKFKLK